MFKFLYRKPLYLLVFLVSCAAPVIISNVTDYKVLYNKSYPSQHIAAIAFYKNNTKMLKSLNSKQEMLGWIVKCKDGYHVTNAKLGATLNVLQEPDVRSGCKVTGNLHTHPKPAPWLTADFFSPEDLKSSQYWTMYLLAQESCKIRYSYKPDKRYGIVLGKLKECR